MRARGQLRRLGVMLVLLGFAGRGEASTRYVGRGLADLIANPVS